MYTITPNQEYILSILNETKVMRKDQAIRLLMKLDAGITVEDAQRCIGQLRHIRKLVWKTDNVFTHPMLFHKPTDDEMLSAIDIMIDLSKQRVLSVSAGPAPFKFRFLSEEGNGARSFAVAVVQPGYESTIMAAPNDTLEGCIAILLLSERSQKDTVKTEMQHYFAIRSGGRYHYFKSG